jgi:hypothetical protein
VVHIDTAATELNMISRLTAIAALFAVLTTATLAVAAHRQETVQLLREQAAPRATVVQLAPVTVVVKRIPAAQPR